jgi:RimJ/RimL family protein N-acetyltransferase
MNHCRWIRTATNDRRRRVASAAVRLETERLVLRPLTADDVDVLTDLDGDPEVLRFVDPFGETPTDRAARRRWIEDRWLPRMLAQAGRPDRGFWLAALAGGEPAGWFHLLDRAAPGEPELGYRLRRAAWGQGLATEGSRALVAFAFADPAVQRVTAKALAVNAASIQVMQKLGMTPAGEGDYRGLPEVRYAIDRATWSAREADAGP